jgi:hypothetical protein
MNRMDDSPAAPVAALRLPKGLAQGGGAESTEVGGAVFWGSVNRALLGLVAAAVVPAALWAQPVAPGYEPNPGAAITQVGTRGANFLRIAPTARSRALGEPGVALLDGAGSLYYNAGAAALVEEISVTGSVTQLYGKDGMEHTYVGAILPIGGAGVIGVHALMFNSGNVEPTREATPYGADPLLGDFMEWRSLAVGATYARRITDRLAMGATGKLIQEGIDFAHVQWTALDLGLIFETGVYGLRLGMAIQHIGGDARFEGPGIYQTVDRQYRIFDEKILGSTMALRYDTEKMSLPTTFRMGVEAPVYGTATSFLGGLGGPHVLNVLGEVTDGFDTAVESRWGLEYAFRDMVFLRAGRHVMADDRRPTGWGLDGYTFGGGIRVPVLLGQRLSVDYAYSAMGILDNIQTFTFQIGSF